MKSKRPSLGKTMINRYLHICVLEKQNYLKGNKFRVNFCYYKQRYAICWYAGMQYAGMRYLGMKHVKLEDIHNFATLWFPNITLVQNFEKLRRLQNFIFLRDAIGVLYDVSITPQSYAKYFEKN